MIMGGSQNDSCCVKWSHTSPFRETRKHLDKNRSSWQKNHFLGASPIHQKKKCCGTIWRLVWFEAKIIPYWARGPNWSLKTFCSLSFTRRLQPRPGPPVATSRSRAMSTSRSARICPIDPMSRWMHATVSWRRRWGAGHAEKRRGGGGQRRPSKTRCKKKLQNTFFFGKHKQTNRKKNKKTKSFLHKHNQTTNNKHK